MDKRENLEQNLYQKELEQELKEGSKKYDDHIVIDGKQYRVPYRMVKEVVFSDVRKDEMIDMEHAARLQYRLMLQDSVLRAKVEFVKQKISVVYNPKDAENRKEKTSLEELIDFISKEGVHLYNNPREVKDFDYVKEMYGYFYDPPAVREHPPYGYTAEEWKGLKEGYKAGMKKSAETNKAEFKEWQDSYAEEHPDVLAAYIKPNPGLRPNLKERLFGKKGKKEKGFWFHGV